MRVGEISNYLLVTDHNNQCLTHDFGDIPHLRVVHCELGLTVNQCLDNKDGRKKGEMGTFTSSMDRIWKFVRDGEF